MAAYKTAAKLEKPGVLHLEELPFRPGDEVEVTLQRRRQRKPTEKRYPLPGKPLRYERPFDPVAEEDLNALR